MIIGLVLIQSIFVITQQQSLIPLLTIHAAGYKRGWFTKNRFRKWSLLGFFFAWIISLFSLPLFYNRMYAIFVVGDISLFWQVMIGPPRYSDPGFAIAATYAIITTITFLYIFFDILKDENRAGNEVKE